MAAGASPASRRPRGGESPTRRFSATEDMSRHLLHFEDYFSSRLFEMDRQDLTQRLEQIEETSLVDRLRAEMLMQSQDRFEPETVAWLFTSLDREQEGWRREVAGVEPVRRRLAHEGWTVYQPLVCDVGREGLTFALREADRLARYLNDVDQFLRQRRQADPGLPAGQPDLFRPNPRGIGATGLLDDGAQLPLRRGAAPARSRPRQPLGRRHHVFAQGDGALGRPPVAFPWNRYAGWVVSERIQPGVVTFREKSLNPFLLGVSTKEVFDWLGRSCRAAMFYNMSIPRALPWAKIGWPFRPYDPLELLPTVTDPLPGVFADSQAPRIGVGLGDS